jgi:hypothetical protein
MLSERLNFCYTESGWVKDKDTDDLLIFLHPKHGSHIRTREEKLPILTSDKIRDFISVKRIDHKKDISYYIYFLYQNALYAISTSFIGEQFEEILVYISTTGIHQYSVVPGREQIENDFKEELTIFKQFNQAMLESVPEYRLLLLTGNCQKRSS